MITLKRKRNKKENTKSKEKYKNKDLVRRDPAEDKNTDSIEVKKGRNVDYTKFLLLFKLKSDTTKFDSLTVVHSSEYKTIIETDQSRLDHMLDTIKRKNICLIIIKTVVNKEENRAVIKKRNKSIVRYLLRSGIPSGKICLKESEDA